MSTQYFSDQDQKVGQLRVLVPVNLEWITFRSESQQYARPVWPFSPHYDDSPPTEEWIDNIEATRRGFGDLTLWRNEDRPRRVWTWEFRLTDSPQLDFLRRFFDEVRGKGDMFWLPSYANNLPIVDGPYDEGLIPGTLSTYQSFFHADAPEVLKAWEYDTITVPTDNAEREAAGKGPGLYERFLPQRYAAFCTRDGTIKPFKVTDISQKLGQAVKVTTESAFPFSSIPPAPIVSWMHPVRFADDIEVAYVTDSVAIVRVRLVELPKDYAPPNDILQAQWQIHAIRPVYLYEFRSPDRLEDNPLEDDGVTPAPWYSYRQSRWAMTSYQDPVEVFEDDAESVDEAYLGEITIFNAADINHESFERNIDFTGEILTLKVMAAQEPPDSGKRLNEFAFFLRYYLQPIPLPPIEVRVYEGLLGLDDVPQVTFNRSQLTLLYRGTIEDISFDPGGEMSVRCTTSQGFEDRPVPAFLVGRSCNWMLYGVGCHDDYTGTSRDKKMENMEKAFAHMCTVTRINSAAPGRQIVYLNGAGALAKETDNTYFRGGRLTLWDDQTTFGGNDNFRRAVRGIVSVTKGPDAQDGNQLRLACVLNMPFPPKFDGDWDRELTLAVGDKVWISPGCNRSRGECKDKFSNIKAFGGFPYMPEFNPAVKGPRPKRQSAPQQSKK